MHAAPVCDPEPEAGMKSQGQSPGNTGQDTARGGSPLDPREGGRERAQGWRHHQGGPAFRPREGEGTTAVPGATAAHHGGGGPGSLPGGQLERVP